MIRVRLLVVLGLSFVASLVLARPAAADNCDIFINPRDCQNTAWTIGVIATLAGGVAVAAVATASVGKKRRPAERREPVAPRSPADASTTNLERPPAVIDIDHIITRSRSDPPSITIQPSDGVVRGQTVTLKSQSDPGGQTVQEVDRGDD